MSDMGTIGCKPGTFQSFEGREHKFCTCKAIPKFVLPRTPCNITGLYDCGYELKCQPDHEGVNRCLGKRNHGDSCSHSEECKPGHSCKEGICMSVLGLGSPCKAKSPQPLDACPPDSWCTQNWLGAYTCQPKANVGEPCLNSGFCKSGLSCNKGQCQSLFTLATGTPTDDALLCETGFAVFGYCAPLPQPWHDLEYQECTNSCSLAGTCACATWEGKNNTGICIPKGPYTHEGQDAIKAVFAMTSGKCYPDLLTPSWNLAPIPAYDCAMRIVGPQLMSKAFCWYLRNIQILNGNGITPNCDPTFSLWLAAFCPL